MNWYKILKAMPLDPNAWKNDPDPHRLSKDQDYVVSPYGGVIRQKQDINKLEKIYKGNHLTFSPIVAAIYANNKASKNDPPVIIEVDVSNLEKSADADASIDYSLDIYLSDKIKDWSEILEKLDENEINIDEFDDAIKKTFENDIDYMDESEEDLIDFIYQQNKPLPNDIVEDEISSLDGYDLEKFIRKIVNEGIPEEWAIKSINQFKVMNEIDLDRLKGIYKVPFVDFNKRFKGNIDSLDEEELEYYDYEVVKDKNGDDLLINSEGRMVLDDEMLAYDGWFEMSPIYLNDKIEGESAWHGTSLERVKKAFPNII